MDTSVQQEVKIPEAFVNQYGISSVVSTNTGLQLLGPQRNDAGNFAISRAGAGWNVKLTGADGHVTNCACQFAGAANGDMTLSGTYNGEAFGYTLSADGKVVNQTAPKNVNAADSQIAKAILKIVFPPKPSPFNPNPAGEEKIAAVGKNPATTITKGPVTTTENPLVSWSCAFAITAAVVAGWELAALSASIAIHIVIYECAIKG